MGCGDLVAIMSVHRQNHQLVKINFNHGIFAFPLSRARLPRRFSQSPHLFPHEVNLDGLYGGSRVAFWANQVRVLRKFPSSKKSKQSKQNEFTCRFIWLFLLLLLFCFFFSYFFLIRSFVCPQRRRNWFLIEREMVGGDSHVKNCCVALRLHCSGLRIFLRSLFRFFFVWPMVADAGHRFECALCAVSRSTEPHPLPSQKKTKKKRGFNCLTIKW